MSKLNDWWKSKRATTKSHTLTPGMFTRHYAPQTPLIMTDEIDAYTKQHPEANVAILYTGKKNSNVKKHISIYQNQIILKKWDKDYIPRY